MGVVAVCDASIATRGSGLFFFSFSGDDGVPALLPPGVLGTAPRGRGDTDGIPGTFLLVGESTLPSSVSDERETSRAAGDAPPPADSGIDSDISRSVSPDGPLDATETADRCEWCEVVLRVLMCASVKSGPPVRKSPSSPSSNPLMGDMAASSALSKLPLPPTSGNGSVSVVIDRIDLEKTVSRLAQSSLACLARARDMLSVDG